MCRWRAEKMSPRGWQRAYMFQEMLPCRQPRVKKIAWDASCMRALVVVIAHAEKRLPGGVTVVYCCLGKDCVGNRSYRTQQIRDAHNARTHVQRSSPYQAQARGTALVAAAEFRVARGLVGGALTGSQQSQSDKLCERLLLGLVRPGREPA
jgi:hypothetical protein